MTNSAGVQCSPLGWLPARERLRRPPETTRASARRRQIESQLASSSQLLLVPHARARSAEKKINSSPAAVESLLSCMPSVPRICCRITSGITGRDARAAFCRRNGARSNGFAGRPYLRTRLLLEFNGEDDMLCDWPAGRLRRFKQPKPHPPPFPPWRIVGASGTTNFLPL